jgi:hypothetical protein
MPETHENTRGQNGAPKPLLDDYLPDFSPRPKYVIATIFPPSPDPLVISEREIADMSVSPVSLQKPASAGAALVIPPCKEERIQGTGGKGSTVRAHCGVASGSGADSSSGLLHQGSTIIPSARRIPEPCAQDAVSRMDLPRGKFRTLERNASIISLLYRLHTSGFRGYCRINRDGMPIILVFDQGRIILAKYDDLAGDSALAMVCTHRFAQVDALISDLDDAQIRLSLEFNPSWKVKVDQQPSWIASPELMPEPGKSIFEDPESTYQNTRSSPGREPLNPDSRLPDASGQRPVALSLSPPSPTTLPDRTVPGAEGSGESPAEEDLPDWKKALGVSPVSSGNGSENLTPQCSKLVPNQDAEVDWKAALTAPITAPYKKIPVSHERICPESPAEEGWKKALFLPVESAIPGEEVSELPDVQKERIHTSVPGFERLSADSVLFDDIPSGKRVPRSTGPEPVEQWRSMGINRGENSSV